jgi:hypothetical protein
LFPTTFGGTSFMTLTRDGNLPFDFLSVDTRTFGPEGLVINSQLVPVPLGSPFETQIMPQPGFSNVTSLQFIIQGDERGPHLDNFVLRYETPSTPVPEPGTLSLMLTGALGLAAYRGGRKVVGRLRARN